MNTILVDHDRSASLSEVLTPFIWFCRVTRTALWIGCGRKKRLRSSSRWIWWIYIEGFASRNNCV